jgi:hypothetical protein
MVKRVKRQTQEAPRFSNNFFMDNECNATSLCLLENTSKATSIKSIYAKSYAPKKAKFTY